MHRNERESSLAVGVVISTYNNPLWLEKVLWGYLAQTHLPAELIIADDGSKEPTRLLIETFAKSAPFAVKHVWQEDDGFQKSMILNKALLAAESPYLIFTDQDCIPRADFVATHAAHAQQGYLLSGGYFKLPMDLSLAITRDDIQSGRAFDRKWLFSKGLKRNFKCTKLYTCKAFARFMNFITPARASWNGCNSSGWRTDMLAIDGYNQQMQYGGQDREFGERLVNLGIRCKQLRYSAICLHLDHKRPYKTPESMAKNRAIRKHTRTSGLVKTPHGIQTLKK